MPAPSYSAARSHAPRLETHFAQLVPERVTPSPTLDASMIEAVIDACFWASVQREEGYRPEISVAIMPPDLTLRPLLFKEPILLSPRALSRLAPAVERPGIHLGVWRIGHELRVWGTTLTVATTCMVVEVLGPGLLVVKHRIAEDSPKFRNVAVFEGERIKLMRRGADAYPGAPLFLQYLLGPEDAHTEENDGDVLLRLAVSMRAHKRGGTLLVVPAGSTDWPESIVRPIPYAVDPPFSELQAPAQALPNVAPLDPARVVDEIAGLTAVDGATLITDRYELLAFGAKIGRPDGRPRVERVVLSEPVEGGIQETVPALQLGGTRHTSAAQFAQDQPSAMAMVASQDGRFTVLAWSESDGLVHAHRVEAFLL